MAYKPFTPERWHAPDVVFGAVQGQLDMPASMREAARQLALDHYAQAEAEDFCGDEVGDHLVPEWVPPLHEWFPLQQLHALGYEPGNEHQRRVYATVSASPHEDEMHGVSLIVVLHNDELKFIMGEQSHVTAIGEWFLLDDFATHEVDSTDLSTSYVVLSVPLRRRQG